MEQSKNEILVLQTLDVNRRLLRARHRNYGATKWTQGILVTLSIILPVVGVLVGPHMPELRPYIALSALTLLLLETALIDRVQKDRLKRGAKLQEQFDTEVFGLPWNRFVTGAPVEPEDVRALSAKPLASIEIAEARSPCGSHLLPHQNGNNTRAENVAVHSPTPTITDHPQKDHRLHDHNPDRRRFNAG